jgi:SAM-dependent methyltransferase
VPSAYDELGPAYDAWCVSVTEDIAWYVELAIESGGPVLEIGVGSGRVAVPTALAGVHVVGLDNAPGMLAMADAKARAMGVALDLRQSDMRDLPDLGTYPLVTVPFRAFLHLRSDEERLAVLQRLHACLDPAGRLAFDVFHPHPVDIVETHDRWMEREPGIEERARWDAAERSLELSVRTSDREATMHLWWATPGDWRRLLTEAGFGEIEVYGWFDRRPLSAASADSVWVARWRTVS